MGHYRDGNPALVQSAAAEVRNPAEALPASDNEPRRFSILPLPTFDVTPETGIAGGAVALMTFRPFANTRPAQAEVETTVTTRRQLIATADADVFLPENKGLISTRFAVMRFPELYWGVGAETPRANEEQYDNRRLDAAVDGVVRVPMSAWSAELYVGPSFAAYGMWDIVPAQADTLLSPDHALGTDGGWSLGSGAALLVEGRDNRLNPGPQSRMGLVRGLWFAPAWGSDFRFGRLEVDGRLYPTLGPVRLALQGVMRLHAGSPPFRQLALQGGDPLSRGMYTGRFRDQDLVGGQVEVRQHLVWRLGAVAFGGASVVSPTVLSLPSQPLRATTGGGLRVRLDDENNINLRLDLGWTSDGEGGTTGFYAAFGEAF